MSRRFVRIPMVAALVIAAFQASTAWSEVTSARPSESGERTREMAPLPEPEVTFDGSAERVVVRISPRHLSVVRLPFPMRERIAVFENGVRQADVAVDVEHAPITLAVLIENGGRSHQLNSSVTADAGLFVRPLLDVLDRNDRLAVFAYDETVRTIVDFGAPYEEWSAAIGRLPKPRFSETNFHDATLMVLDRLAGMTGRKALLILSTGIDTFSRTGFDDVVARAEQVKVPVYVFNLAELARRRLPSSSWGFLRRVDWKRCEQQLARLAAASGGRAYLEASSSDVPGVYDEMIEDLRVRYVLTYRSDARTTSGVRTVQVAVMDPQSRETAHAAGIAARLSNSRVVAEARYTPMQVSADATRALSNSAEGR